MCNANLHKSEKGKVLASEAGEKSNKEAIDKWAILYVCDKRMYLLVNEYVVQRTRNTNNFINRNYKNGTYTGSLSLREHVNVLNQTCSIGRRLLHVLKGRNQRGARVAGPLQ